MGDFYHPNICYGYNTACASQKVSGGQWSPDVGDWTAHKGKCYEQTILAVKEELVRVVLAHKRLKDWWICHMKRSWRSWGCLACRRLRGWSSCCVTWWVGWERMTDRLLSAVYSDTRWGNGQKLKYKEICHLKIWKFVVVCASFLL